MRDEGSDGSLFLDPPVASRRGAQPEPPAGPQAPLVEVEGGRRRRLAVLVVVALLVGGVIANRTSTERADEEDALHDQRQDLAAPAESPANLPQSLRTTDRLGPLLPEPTGTTLVLAAGTQVIVLDVDSGTVRSVQLADLDVGASYPWGSPVLAVGDSIVVRSRPPRGKVIPRADGGPVTDLAAGSGGGLYPTTTPGRYWVEERRGEPRLEEVDLVGDVSRTVPVPNGQESIVWDGTGFVQTVDGAALAFPADGGEAVPLASGLAVAGDATTVALLRCAPSGSCELVLADRSTGEVRTVPRTGAVQDFQTGFTGASAGAGISPDGRWLLLPVIAAPRPGSAESLPALAVIDVTTGTVRAVEPGGTTGQPAGAFSQDGRWLFLGRPVGTVTAELGAVRLADGARFDLDVELSVRASFGLVLEAVPSLPADRGADGG